MWKLRTYHCIGMKSLSLLLALSLLAHASADDSFASMEGDQRFQEDLDCISGSGDEDLCERFLQINSQLPRKLLVAYYDCVGEILSNNIGECREDKELYYSAENRREINKCIFSKADDLTDEEMDQWKSVQEKTKELAAETDCTDDDSN